MTELEQTVFGYLAIAALLLGAVLLTPRLTPAILSLLQARKPLPLHLASGQLQGAPGQAAVSMGFHSGEREPDGFHGHHGDLDP